MIGFTLDARTWDEEGEERTLTILLRLDTDTGDVPVLEVRAVDGDALFNVSVEDAEDAVSRIDSQLQHWKRGQTEAGS